MLISDRLTKLETFCPSQGLSLTLQRPRSRIHLCPGSLGHLGTGTGTASAPYLHPRPCRGPPSQPSTPGPCSPHSRCHWPQVHPVPIQSLYNLGPYLSLPTRPVSLAPNTAGPFHTHSGPAGPRPHHFTPPSSHHPDRSSHTLRRPLLLPGPWPFPPSYLYRTLSPPGHFLCPGLVSHSWRHAPTQAPGWSPGPGPPSPSPSPHLGPRPRPAPRPRSHPPPRVPRPPESRGPHGAAPA